MRIGRLMGIGGALTALAVAGGFVVLIFLVLDLRNDARDERDAADALTVSADLRRSVVEVEASLRGYAIRRDPVYLESYRETVPELPVLERQLVALASHDDHQQQAAQMIAVDVEAFRARWVEPMLAAVRVRRSAAPAELLASGKRRLDGLHREFARFDAVEGRFRARRHTEVQHKAVQALVAAGVGLGASTLFMLVTGVALARFVVWPLRRLAVATQQLARGDYTTRVAAGGVGEAADLAAAFNTMAEALEEQRDELEAQNSELDAQQNELARSLHDLEFEHGRTAARSAFATQLAREGDLELLSRVVLDGVADIVSADVGALSLRGVADSDVVALAAVRGLDSSALDEEVAPGVGLDGRALAERRHVVASPGETALRVRAFGREVAVRHELHIPLVVQEEALGVLTLGRIGEQPFTDDEIELVDQLAYQAALALANALTLARSLRLVGINTAVLDAAVAGVAMLDPEGRFAFVNAGMERMLASLGVDPSKDIHSELASLAQRSVNPGETADLFGRVIRSDEPAVVHEFVDAPTTRAFEVRGAEVTDASGRSIGRLLTMRETTSEREAARLKDEFVATVSHELRTPLTSINGYVEILLDDDHDLNAEQRGFLEVIARSSERLMRLVGDLLLVGQIDAGKLELVSSPVDLGTIVSDSAVSARAFAGEKGVEVQTELRAIPPLLGDPVRLAQVVDNLLSNAIKFTPEGGRVDITLSSDNGRCVLEVSDSGIGIPEAERSHLFQRFFRTSRAAAHAIAGTGLGLAITKAIVDGHGGTIAVVDREGPGTTFRVELPASVT